ncbi:MAG: alpha/beta fold hydrolase [Eubacteriales bacterium]
MKFEEFGKENALKMIFLHGGGLAPWSFYAVAQALKEKYHVLIPVLDGHNGADRDFTSIEDNAREIIDFIDENFGGSVYLIGGLSLGAQVLVEMLSQKPDICRYAIIESALVLPMKVTEMLIKPTFKMSYPLVKKRWFAKLQFDSLRIGAQFFDAYYRDSSAITEKNMIAFLEANADYKLKPTLSECRAKTLVLVGEKEQRIMKKSAIILHQTLENSSCETLRGFYHGDISINHPDIYAEKLRRLIDDGQA